MTDEHQLDANVHEFLAFEEADGDESEPELAESVSADLTKGF